MIGKKLAAIVLLMGTALVAAPVGPASAGGGPPDYAGCTITVDPSTFQPGATVAVAGIGLQPSYETRIEFDAVLVGSVVTDVDGSFATTITIPDDATVGAHTITAQCDIEGNVAITDVEIDLSSGSTTPTTGGNSSTGLPSTGSDAEPLVVAGGAALLAGVTFVLVAKRRRRATVAS